MLRDPKSRALAEHFGGQWLQFRALESVTRDRDKFPEFEDYLRLSMRRETELFIEHIVRNDRSVLDFIDGRYSFLNERLARTTASPNVSGPEFRQVDLSATPRGGVVTQGSVLAVSSYATRTSPVLRGKWVLDNLLNAPPPEPPADVPNLDEATIGTSASMREQLEEHRKNPICASCHRRMDPLGFGLENFDAVGAWRTLEGKFPIDASGQLPDGRRFTGPEELRKILSADRDAFARAITSKLLTYGLGRGLERYDARTSSSSPAGCRNTTTGSRGWCSRSSRACRSSRGAPRRRHPGPRRPSGHRPASEAPAEREAIVGASSAMITSRASICTAARSCRGWAPRWRAARARRDDAGICRAGGRKGAAAARVHLRAERHHDGRLDAEGRPARLRVLAHPQAARAVPGGHAGALRARASQRLRARRRPRRSRARRRAAF